MHKFMGDFFNMHLNFLNKSKWLRRIFCFFILIFFVNFLTIQGSQAREEQFDLSNQLALYQEFLNSAQPQSHDISKKDYLMISKIIALARLYVHQENLSLDQQQRLDKLFNEVNCRLRSGSMNFTTLNLFHLQIALILSPNKILEKDQSVSFFDVTTDFISSCLKKTPENLEELECLFRTKIPSLISALERPIIILYVKSGELPIEMFNEVLFQTWPPISLAALPLPAHLHNTPHGNILTTPLSFLLHDIGHSRVYYESTKDLNFKEGCVLKEAIKNTFKSTHLQNLFVFLLFHEFGIPAEKEAIILLKKISKEGEPLQYKRELGEFFTKRISKIFANDPTFLQSGPLKPFEENLIVETKKYIEKSSIVGCDDKINGYPSNFIFKLSHVNKNSPENLNDISKICSQILNIYPIEEQIINRNIKDIVGFSDNIKMLKYIEPHMSPKPINNKSIREASLELARQFSDIP